jgi:S1-C subfamily serine protease
MSRIFATVFALFLTLLPAYAADDVQAVSRSVVRVVTVATADGEVVGFGHGSGIAISPTRILTNAHVVESVSRYPGQVALGVVPSEGDKGYPANLISLDSRRDLALIELQSGRLPAAVIYTGPLASGAEIVALGYPGNVDLATARSATDYIVPRSPIRSDGNISNLQAIDGVAALVHTAKISRGNSGGPLVDQCGRIVGINTFITRADDGDSSFAFAVSVRELTRFLGESRQEFTSVGSSCISMADADARERAALDAESRATADAESARLAKQSLARERRLADLTKEAQATRENRIAQAGVLFVLGALALGAALIFYGQKDVRKTRIAGIAGAVLMLIAIVLFITRPDGSASEADLQDEKLPVPEVAPKLAGGNMICTIQPERSRITVSDTNDVPVKIDTQGCVNGRTQYTQASDGRWQRILVPNEEATVTIASFDATMKNYRVDRYLLSAEEMQQARKVRTGMPVGSCSADPEAMTTLTIQQEAVRSVLPTSPNERLVYRCQGASEGAMKAAAAR